VPRRLRKMENVMDHQRRLKKGAGEWIGWLLVALVAGSLLWFSTQDGIGLVSDSYFYLGGADGLRSGQGFARPAAFDIWKPITHFPPLYSCLLFLTNLIIPSPLLATRWLQIMIYAGNSSLFGWLIYRGTSSAWVGWVCALVAMFSPTLLNLHAAVLSEGLFFFFCLLFLWQLVLYISNHNRWNLLLLGFISGGAVLTRYAGVILIPVGLIALLVYAEGAWKKRIGAAMMFLVTGGLLPLVWYLRNLLVTGTGSNRVLAWHPFSSLTIFQAADQMRFWFIPVDIPGRLEIALSGVAVLLVLWRCVFVIIQVLLSRPRERTRRDVLVTAASFSFIAYAGLLLVSMVFLDAAIELNERLMAPGYIFLLLIVLNSVGSWLVDEGRPGYIRLISGVAIAILLSITIVRGLATVDNLSHSPYAIDGWRESPAVQFVADLDGDTLIFSNEIDALYLLTGHTAALIPVYRDPVNLELQTNYEEQIIEMRARIQEENGYLVLFSTLQGQPHFPPEETLTEGLQPLAGMGVDSVFVAP